jgi:hypothetical protein
MDPAVESVGFVGKQMDITYSSVCDGVMGVIYVVKFFVIIYIFVNISLIKFL